MDVIVPPLVTVPTFLAAIAIYSPGFTTGGPCGPATSSCKLGHKFFIQLHLAKMLFYHIIIYS